MQNNLQYLYKKALDARAPWTTRWDAAMRYTMPTSEAERPFCSMRRPPMRWIIWPRRCTHC